MIYTILIILLSISIFFAVVYRHYYNKYHEKCFLLEKEVKDLEGLLRHKVREENPVSL
jgi:hypothetical protein